LIKYIANYHIYIHVVAN